MPYPLCCSQFASLIPGSDDHVRQGAGNVWVDLGYVLLQTVVVGVALITEVTGERFCSRVSEQMSLHIVELLEPPLTDGATERSVIGVDLHVSL